MGADTSNAGAAERARFEAGAARRAAKALKLKEREEKKQAKEAARLAKAAAVARCVELSRTVPPEFQAWGYVRTHAWREAAKVCAQIGKHGRGSLLKISEAIRKVERACVAPVEELTS